MSDRVTQIFATIGAICTLATALAPLFPVGSRPARFLNWLGSQTRFGK